VRVNALTIPNAQTYFPIFSFATISIQNIFLYKYRRQIIQQLVEGAEPPPVIEPVCTRIWDALNTDYMAENIAMKTIHNDNCNKEKQPEVNWSVYISH